MLMPKTEDEAAAIIRDHAASKTFLSICGGNSRPGFGNAVAASAALSARDIAGIVAYNSGKMVTTAKAGTPMAEIEALLCREPPDDGVRADGPPAADAASGEPTIGGVFAANVSGPRQFVAGVARDSLLGVRFVNSRGEIVKAGGRVKAGRSPIIRPVRCSTARRSPWRPSCF